jgi:hypothetical protein
MPTPIGPVRRTSSLGAGTVSINAATGLFAAGAGVVDAAGAAPRALGIQADVGNARHVRLVSTIHFSRRPWAMVNLAGLVRDYCLGLPCVAAGQVD